jgi:hypothetical protein
MDQVPPEAVKKPASKWIRKSKRLAPLKREKLYFRMK